MDLRELADDLITREGRGTPPFGTYIVPGFHPAAELGRHIERTVFLEFFGNSPELLAEEYQAYEAGSVFFLVLDHALREPAGGMRVLLPHAGAKSLDDIERAWGEPADEVIARSCPTMRREDLWDVATLGVMADYRGSSTSGLISLALYQSLISMGVANDVKWMVAVLDLVVLDLIQSLTSRPFKAFAGLEPRNYLDSPASLPVYIDMDEWRPRIELTDPNMHSILVHGTGLEAGLSTPRWGPEVLTAPRPDIAEAV